MLCISTQKALLLPFGIIWGKSFCVLGFLYISQGFSPLLYCTNYFFVCVTFSFSVQYMGSAHRQQKRSWKKVVLFVASDDGLLYNCRQSACGRHSSGGADDAVLQRPASALSLLLSPSASASVQEDVLPKGLQLCLQIGASDRDRAATLGVGEGLRMRGRIT